VGIWERLRGGGNQYDYLDVYGFSDRKGDDRKRRDDERKPSSEL
jgi:hypothetical protein